MSRKDETPIVTEEVKSDGFDILTLSIILCKHSSKSKHLINEQALKAVSNLRKYLCEISNLRFLFEMISYTEIQKETKNRYQTCVIENDIPTEIIPE